MNAYDCFALFYDEMMADAPYMEWQKFFCEAVERYKLKRGCLADIGCGTGKLSLFFVDQGFEVYAVDPSPNMLMQLEQKLTAINRDSVHLFEMDAANLILPVQIQVAVSFCDSLNYILDIQELETAFAKVFAALESGGAFFFDLHTPFKIRELYGDSLFVGEQEEYTYIWETQVDSKNLILTHDLLFFVKETGESYRKHSETHQQRAYEEHVIHTCLERVGFSKIECFADFKWNSPNEDSERYLFVAVK